MANRAWRNELNNRSYMYGSTYGAPITYNQNIYDDRRNYNSRGGYQEDPKRGKRPYDNIGVSPKKVVKEPNPGTFRRNYNTVAPPVIKKPINKYSVKPPKVTLDLKEGSVAVLKARYPRLYIPSDFFHSDFRWQDVFPLYTPMTLGKESKFQVFHHDVEPLVPFNNERLNPVDANYTYSAKVMLLESMNMTNLLKNVCEAGGNERKSFFKSLSFLVGTKTKNEPLCIGGPWSPNLDGPNPDEDPQILIKTAIRTFKEYTSIDLTPCKEWHRFIEFHYYRPADRQGLNISNDNDENRTETENNFRVETVVIFVPSIWDCMLDEDSWEDLKTRYAMALEAILTPPLPEPIVEIIESEEKKDDNVSETLDSASKHEDAEDVRKDDEVSKLTLAEEVKVVEPVLNEVKELSEKDKKRLEGLYKMNESSSIIVHPNKDAKNGKFQCQFMSLASLLEYRNDDQKEHTFEVSMFAEQFQEMLERDAAFKIYKALLKLPNQVELEKLDNEPDAKRRREETSDTTTVTEAGKIDPELLLSFCTFDIDHADYIKEHDLEDIVQSVGLELSRSQARKLVSKAVNHKGCVHYREFTIDTEDMVSTDSDLDLSKGNKSKLIKLSDESTIYLGGAKETEAQIKAIEAKIKEIVKVFNKTKLELESSRTLYHKSKDLENSLRHELRELEATLYSERKNVRDVTQTQDVYNGLLRMAKDVLERAKAKIDRQLEKEAEKDQPKPLVESVTNGN